MSRKLIVQQSTQDTEEPSVKKASSEMPTSENLTDSLGSIRENCLDKPIGLIDRLIQKEISLCSENLCIDSEELQAWITLQAEIPPKSLLHALRTARQYGLDLLQEEVLVTKYDECWQVSISVDGWMKIINGHPAFIGLTFTQSSEEKEGLPLWMECAIHRSDRAIPATIREYLTEVRNETEIWQKMPRRMLRHRVLQQCARVALSIQLSESKTEKKPIDLNQEGNNSHATSNKVTHHQVSGGCKLLKEKLGLKTCLREKDVELS